MDVTINCGYITDEESFHKIFAKSLQLPPYYGNNLDALFDCLTTMPAPSTITLYNVQSMLDNLGGYGRAALNLIETVERENPGRLTVNVLS